MSKKLIVFPKDATRPDWDYYGAVDGVHRFKIHARPQDMTIKALRNTVLQGGKFNFTITKADRVPGKPAFPPLQPYYVWGKKL